MPKLILTPAEIEARRLKQNAAGRASYYKYHERNRADKLERARRERLEHPERHKARQKLWRQRHPEKALAVSRENHAKNREQDRARAKRWRQSLAPEQKQKYGRYTTKAQAYYREHKEQWRAKYRRYYAKRRADEIARSNIKRAGKMRATPPWADMERIADFYREAQRLTDQTGVEHQVDHIVPFKGESDEGVHVVCGLHCEANLRVVTAFENLSKSNRWVV